VQKFPTERQIEVLKPFLPRDPDLFVFAGVGDGYEPELARGLWPSARIAAFDPDQRCVDWQLSRGWNRTGDVVVCGALADTYGTMPMHLAGMGCSTLHPEMVSVAPRENVVNVSVRPLDSWRDVLKPERAVLWIDAEGFDHRVVYGAGGVVSHGASIVVKEVWTARPDLRDATRRLNTYLDCFNFRMLETFGVEWWGHNEVWVRESHLRELFGWTDA